MPPKSLVKLITTPLTMDLSGKNQAGDVVSVGAVLVSKVTAKGGKRKYFEKSCHISAELITIEVIAGTICRRIVGSDFAPKTRVAQILYEGENQNQFFVLSKAIPGFWSFYDKFRSFRNEKEIISENLSYLNRRDLAKLFVSLMCIEDADAHDNNWGFNRDGSIVRIDFDGAFGRFAQNFSKKHILNQDDPLYRLYLWNNLIYKAKDPFSILSSEDIVTLPILQDAKPYNFPFLSIEGTKDFLKNLSTDRQFIIWKFFYFTKFLILHDEKNVDVLFQAHSMCGKYFDAEFKKIILARCEKIKEVLLNMQEYRNFLKNNMSNLIEELETEINEYNTEFTDVNRVVKPHKKWLIIDIETTLINLNQLKKEAVITEQNETSETKNQREIKLNLTRFRREKDALLHLGKVIDTYCDYYDSELSSDKKPKVSIDLNTKLALLLKDQPKAIEDRIKFYIKQGVEPGILTVFSKENPKRKNDATLGEFFQYIENRIQQMVDGLLSKEEKMIDHIEDRIVQFVITPEYQNSFSEENISEIFDIANEIKNKVENSFNIQKVILNILKTIPFEKIPLKIIRYALMSTGSDAEMIILSANQLKMVMDKVEKMTILKDNMDFNELGVAAHDAANPNNQSLDTQKYRTSVTRFGPGMWKLGCKKLSPAVSLPSPLL